MTARRLLLALFVLVFSASPQLAAAQGHPLAQGRCLRAAAEAGCAQTSALTTPASPTDIISLWGGARESIALRADGTVWTWGINACDPIPLTTGICGKL